MHFHVFDIEDLILFNAGRLSSARALLYLCSVNQRDVICPSRKHNLHISRRSQVTKKKKKEKKDTRPGNNVGTVHHRGVTQLRRWVRLTS